MTGCAMGGCASLVVLQLQKREINDKGGDIYVRHDVLEGVLEEGL